MVDALGLPLTFEITEGQRHDNRPAKELVARVGSTCLLGDKACLSRANVHSISERALYRSLSYGSFCARLPLDGMTGTRFCSASAARKASES